MNRVFPTDSQPQGITGQLLVAAPAAVHHPLARRVVLVLEHSPEHTVGVVLNSAENQAVQEWCRSLSELSDKQAALSRIKRSIAEQQTSTDAVTVTLCVSRPVDNIDDAAAELGSGLRVFLGRVEWDAAAINRELAAGVWMTIPAFPSLVFGECDDLWKTAVRCAGEMVITTAQGVRGDEDFEWN